MYCYGDPALARFSKSVLNCSDIDKLRSYSAVVCPTLRDAYGWIDD